MKNTINTNNSRNGKVSYVKITIVKNINSKNIYRSLVHYTYVFVAQQLLYM
jgi:hypothetical protein